MRLAINIDHIATLRNVRGGNEPDPAFAARVAEKAGADGIVCHLREDRRHIRDRDVHLLRKKVRTQLDLEMAATPEIIRIARRVKPHLATLVPERRKELTTEGGLNVVNQRTKLRNAIRLLHARGIRVSLFVDPRRNQVKAAKEIGADVVEIHTGEYADAKSRARRNSLLRKVHDAARYAKSLGLRVHAGHGLNYENIKPVVRIREIQEVSIGHAVVVRAALVGLGQAVREMVRLVKGK